jgi:hypothetical protein
MTVTIILITLGTLNLILGVFNFIANRKVLAEEIKQNKRLRIDNE